MVAARVVRLSSAGADLIVIDIWVEGQNLCSRHILYAICTAEGHRQA